MKRGHEMENEEERKVAKEVKAEFFKKDYDCAKSYGAKIYDYLYEKDTSYRGGRTEDCPDSFGKELRVFIENGGTPGDFFRKIIEGITKCLNLLLLSIDVAACKSGNVAILYSIKKRLYFIYFFLSHVIYVLLSSILYIKYIY